MNTESDDDKFDMDSSYQIDSPSARSELFERLINERVTVSFYQKSESNDGIFVIGYAENVGPEWMEFSLPERFEMPDGSSIWSAVTFIDDIKVQFDVMALHCSWESASACFRTTVPELVYRFQRRGAFRVRPSYAPLCNLVVRAAPGNEDRYPIIDISATGVAFETPDLQSINLGEEIVHARLELGPRAPIPCTVLVCTISEPSPSDNSTVCRVGAQFTKLPGEVERQIQRYVQSVERSRLRAAREKESSAKPACS